MSKIARIKTGWLSFELPGYRPHPRPGTYSLFSYEELPPIQTTLDDDFRWLKSEPVKQSAMAERWDQTTNVLLLVPLVKHKDNAVISEIAWDWLLPEEIAEMPSLAVGQSVAFFDAQMGYHEAVVIAKNDATTLPYLELLWWDVQAGQERREANVGHQDVVGVAVAHWRGLNE